MRITINANSREAQVKLKSNSIKKRSKVAPTQVNNHYIPIETGSLEMAPNKVEENRYILNNLKW